ncbi:LINE-1 reverse transcriptase homolog [Linum grandiflorum]
MIVMSWNYRGLGQPRSVQVLRELTEAHRPGVVIIIETLTNKQRMETIRAELKFDGCFAIDARGHSGGLCALWKDGGSARVVHYGQNFIMMEITEAGRDSFYLTGFYGYPHRSQRKASWDLLRSVHATVPDPWCCIGDYNNLLDASEKKGRHPHLPTLITGFREAVLDCGLTDIHMEGYPFTWEKSRGTAGCVEEKLDRALATANWKAKFPFAMLRNCLAPVSDHSPLVLDTHPMVRIHHRRRFRFENKWRTEPQLREVMEKGWEEATGSEINIKLDKCATVLNSWGRDLHMLFRDKLTAVDRQLEELRWSDATDDVADYNQCCAEKLTLLQQQDDHWRQRAKQFWCKDGDLNTKFFHSIANGRRKRKEITRLRDTHGQWVTEQPGVMHLAMTYFENLFAGGLSNWEAVVQHVQPVVSTVDNELLLAPFTHEEFRAAMFSMGPDKAPGPDGFNSAFYQHFWPLVGKDVVTNCIDWLTRESLPNFFQETSIILLPKGDNPESMKDWCPISLCNVLYRLIAKVLANRLRRILPGIISEEQSVFVNGRSIVDNVMFAFEMLHSMKSKGGRKTGEVAVKIDISKAFDRVDWKYMEEILRKMGFAERWIRLMMMCITSVDYHVVVNKRAVGPIIPGRGLRQGCPLSPFLFIICVEGLSALLKSDMEQGEIHGGRVNQRAPPISHLFFADDSFFFCRAEIPEVRRLRRAFDIYESASGQSINFAKSGAFFSPNVDNMLEVGLRHILGITQRLDTSRYLGMPSMIGRKKKNVFGYLKQRVRKRIQNWQGKPISKGVCEVLIKSVLQALPTYCMNVFLLPITLAEELERMLNSFWWGTKGSGGSGIPWM